MLPIMPKILQPSRVCYFTNGLLPALRSSNQLNDERQNWRFTIHTFQLPTQPLSLCYPLTSEQIDHCSPFPSFFSLAIGNGRRNTLMWEVRAKTPPMRSWFLLVVYLISRKFCVNRSVSSTSCITMTCRIVHVSTM